MKCWKKKGLKRDKLYSKKEQEVAKREYDLYGKEKAICFEREGNKYRCNMRKCLNGYRLQDMIGQGQSGIVYSACKNHNCNTAIKILFFDVPTPSEDCNIKDPNVEPGDCLCTSIEEFKEEVEIMASISKLGIGPKLIGWWICSDVYNERLGKISAGFIAMEKWGITYTQWKKQYKPNKEQKKEFLRLLARSFSILDKHKFLHKDFHSGNVVIDSRDNGDPYRVGIIDYTEVKSLSQVRRNPHRRSGIMTSNFRQWVNAGKDGKWF